ncbi:MAG: DUF3820 family protein [Parachlamydiales bacterium]
MGLLKQETFVCVDCESTGLDRENDRIIEVGAIRFTLDKVLDRFETLVDPGRPIPEESQRIHRITDKMVEGKPPIEEVLPTLLPFLDKAIIIGHGISFDIELISNAAKRAEIATTLPSRKTIDTLRLARYYGQSPKNSLEGLRKHFNIPAEMAHRAMDDAYINMEVFKRLIAPFKTTEQLFQTLEKPILLPKMPLGKHKGRPFAEVPVDYLRWAVRQEFDIDLLYSIKQELKKRQSGQGFGQAANPFAVLSANEEDNQEAQEEGP